MFTTKCIVLYICIIWSYNVLWSAQGFTGWTEYYYAKNLYICVFGGIVSLSYDICFAFFCIFFPVMASIVYYALIFITMHRSKTALRRHQGNSLSRREGYLEHIWNDEFRLACTLFIILIVFTICRPPSMILLMITLHCLLFYYKKKMVDIDGFKG